MNSLIKALVSKKVVRFFIYAVLGVVAVAGVLVMGVIYYLVGVYNYGLVRSKIDEPKYRAEMERVTDRLIPSDFTLTESKFYPKDGIDTTHELTRTYTVNKSREVVIDELRQSLTAQGYSPEESDFLGNWTKFYTYGQPPFFIIEIPYEEPPIHIEVYVTP